MSTTKAITAYELTKQLNKALADNNIDQIVKPQMMYNYVKNGLVKKNEKNLIDQEIADAFITKFVNKRIAK